MKHALRLLAAASADSVWIQLSSALVCFMAAKTVLTQGSVLDGAVAEWSETAEVEVPAVARRAGVSAGLPCPYFFARAGLLVALVEDFCGSAGTCRDDVCLRRTDMAAAGAAPHYRLDDALVPRTADPGAAARTARPRAGLCRAQPMASQAHRNPVADRVWLFVAGAVGVPAGRDEYR